MLQILFTIAAIYGLKVHLLDATNAFIGSKLDKQIFMEISKGLPKNLLPGNNYVCKLLQSLYRLRQSTNLWNHKVKDYVTLIGFIASTIDPSIFINQRGIIIALYVNNILVFRKDKKSINATKTKLKAFHLMKDSGLMKKILRI